MRLNTTDYSDFHGGVKCEETHFKKLDLFIYFFSKTHQRYPFRHGVNILNKRWISDAGLWWCYL